MVRRRDHAAWGILGLADPGQLAAGDVGISQVPGEPCCAFAPALDPGRTIPSSPSRFRCCPRLRHGEGSHKVTSFEAQSRGFGTGCLRFAPPVTRSGRKTRFRLLAKLCREGLVTLRVRTKGFTMRRASIPLPHALPGAMSPLSLFGSCWPLEFIGR